MRRSYIRGDEPARFWPKVFKSDGCWLWIAALNDNGYGVFRLANSKNTRAHQWSYEHLVGPVPDGMELDHTCRTPACVNPEHLEPVTHAENCARSNAGRRSWRSERTICKNGHPKSVYGYTKTPKGRKPYTGCRECDREARGRFKNRQLGLHA